jgi:hypothetical protein
MPEDVREVKRRKEGSLKIRLRVPGAQTVAFFACFGAERACTGAGSRPPPIAGTGGAAGPGSPSLASGEVSPSVPPTPSPISTRTPSPAMQGGPSAHDREANVLDGFCVQNTNDSIDLSECLGPATPSSRTIPDFISPISPMPGSLKHPRAPTTSDGTLVASTATPEPTAAAAAPLSSIGTGQFIVRVHFDVEVVRISKKETRKIKHEPVKLGPEQFRYEGTFDTFAELVAKVAETTVENLDLKGMSWQFLQPKNSIAYPLYTNVGFLSMVEKLQDDSRRRYSPEIFVNVSEPKVCSSF